MIISLTPIANSPPLLRLPLLSHGIAAGFPSPADDYIDRKLNLTQFLIKHESATYYAKANGDSLNDRGIFDKDLLIIDRSLDARQGDIVVAAVNGELCCKILDLKNKALLSANSDFPAIDLPEDCDLIIEGVVIHAIHHIRWPS